jgi:hypothetical protein
MNDAMGKVKKKKPVSSLYFPFNKQDSSEAKALERKNNRKNT